MQGTRAQLDAEGQRLLASMPAGLRMAELAAKYPRLVNQIARLWMHPDRMRQFFDETLLDIRGGRSGFSETVIMELMALRDHHLNILPKKSGVWDEAPGVDRGR